MFALTVWQTTTSISWFAKLSVLSISLLCRETRKSAWQYHLRKEAFLYPKCTKWLGANIGSTNLIGVDMYSISRLRKAWLHDIEESRKMHGSWSTGQTPDQCAKYVLCVVLRSVHCIYYYRPLMLWHVWLSRYFQVDACVHLMSELGSKHTDFMALINASMVCRVGLIAYIHGDLWIEQLCLILPLNYRNRRVHFNMAT